MPYSATTTTSSTLAPASAQPSRASSTRRRSEQHLRPPGLHRNDTNASTATSRQRSSREERRGRSSSRRRNAAIPKAPANGQWKKLLWVKQSYPDNYTDEETFLDHLQRNPRLRPYEFWPLVADSTIIVQHVCSVLIFVCCFAAIFEKRVSPQRTAAWATACTVAGWVFRDYWQSRDASHEEQEGPQDLLDDDNNSTGASADAVTEADFGPPFKELLGIPITSHSTATAPGTAATSRAPSRAHSRNPSLTSLSMNGTVSSSTSPAASGDSPTSPTTPSYISPHNSHEQKSARLSPRMQERLTTAKSAILIYCSLLGLSPILKSLTKSTSSDSIWALSSWLLILNVFTFDYGAGPEVKFPASLSTNAALMASTVLASRLKSTTDVFSLTLFSIEVFGLFPVFRRHLRHHSWTGHVCLTILLVVLASGGLGMTISGGGLGFGLLGVVLGVSIIGLSMGMTSWWLIGLQRYKNEIHGPWDPARPIIRRQWP